MSSPGSRHEDPQQQQHDHAVSPPTSQHDSDGRSSVSAGSPGQSANFDNAENTSFATASEPQEKHPRARRKRTGAQDKMILEEAYKNNSKPDKQARLALVERVSLTEKEVQVWFQNRRQNDRRKSRPLTHDELAQLQYHGIRLVSEDGTGDNESVLKVTHGPVPVSDPVRSPPSSSPFEPPGHARSFSEAAAYRNHQGPPSQESHSDSHDPSSSFPGVGYIANRRRETGSFSTPSSQTSSGYNSFSYKVEGVPRPSPSDTSPSQGTSLTSTPQSHMRISCSLEGKAEIISGNEPPSSSMPEPNTQSSPSALPAPTWPRELRRSQSAVTPGSSEGIRLPPISNLIHQVGLSRQPHGRSRDVEAWESCAASQTRDALTAFAENESSGSAAAKISLIRSTSNASSTADSHHNGALQPSSGSKRNAPLSQRRDPQLAKRAKLSRANSNVARLGGGDDVCIKTPPVGDVIKETDSDKENWSPVGHVRPQRRPRDEGAPDRRPLPSGPVGGLRERSTLRDTRGRASPSLFSTRANTTPARRGKDQGVEIFVDGTEQPEDPVSPDEDNEVERFMATGSASPRKREMEIVEGLLSLRRGAWTMR